VSVNSARIFTETRIIVTCNYFFFFLPQAYQTYSKQHYEPAIPALNLTNNQLFFIGSAQVYIYCITDITIHGFWMANSQLWNRHINSMANQIWRFE
jgi:hypothetical protein